MLQSFFLRMVLGALLCLVLLMPGGVLLVLAAQTGTGAHAAGTVQGQVTIMLPDMSGSMSTNDQDKIRCSAVNEYIDLSGPGDEIGVIGLDSPLPVTTGGAHNFAQALLW